MKNDVVLNKSKAFALRIIKLYKYLCEEKKEYILSKQILRSGTSVGANTREAKRGQTKPDFYAKLNIALKEADETAYWLELLHESNYIDKKSFDSIYADCDEIIALLVSITKTQKENKPNEQ
ncbi:MAG: four helix bundle protein [Oscillospiraceae bacterium]|nr:four helix bundle protein [Oscillospiraceae bacterium]